MIFRKDGKLVEICRSDYKTDELYYNEIYKLKKECNKQVVDINPINTCNIIQNNSTKNISLVTSIQNLFLKNYSI